MFSKTGFHFLRGTLDAAFPWGEPYGCLPSFAPYNSPLMKWREAFMCYFSVLVFYWPPLEIFLPTPVAGDDNDSLEAPKIWRFLDFFPK